MVIKFVFKVMRVLLVTPDPDGPDDVLILFEEALILGAVFKVNQGYVFGLGKWHFH